MLSTEQLERRQRGIGASEVAAIFGLDRFMSPLDVWKRKRRGKNGEIPALEPPTPAPDTPSAFEPLVTAEPMVAGSILEDGIVKLYEHVTGSKTKPQTTFEHPDKPWALATPDRFVKINRRWRRGLEVKLVGHWMADDWADEELPPRVWIQCQWGMAITGKAEWDAAALLEGSRFRLHRLERDDAWIAEALEEVERWWLNHVVGNEPPEPRDAKDLARFSRMLNPLDNGETLDLLGGDPKLLGEFDALCKHLMKIQKSMKILAGLKAETKAKLEALVGPYRGAVGSVGRFAFPSVAGGVSWKKIAEHLNEGPVPESVIEAFRSDPYRKSQLYPLKKAKK